MVCCVRDTSRFNADKGLRPNIEIIEMDFLDKDSVDNIPKDIDGAYYLLHSMSATSNYEGLELRCASNFSTIISKTNAKQVIHLSGIINEESLLRHLSSKKPIEIELGRGTYQLATLRDRMYVLNEKSDTPKQGNLIK